MRPVLLRRRKVEASKEELESLRRSRGKVFRVPPIEWIEERLSKLKEILERNSDRFGRLYERTERMWTTWRGFSIN